MNAEAARKIADAVLYEGYMLYPYRPSAMKNRQRWSFGILYPPAYREVRVNTERSAMHSECLLEAIEGARLSVELQLRFLHLERRQVAKETDGRLYPASPLMADDPQIGSGEEAVERNVNCEWNPEVPLEHAFTFPETCEEEILTDSGGQNVGMLTRILAAISGKIAMASERLGDRLLKLTIEVENTTPAPMEIERETALLRSLVSAHTILAVRGGQFISLLDPPPEVQLAVAECRNIGNFPVLVGTPPECSLLLCSPIILYDYPQIAPESAGDFFDGTEMDEMLTLRVLTLTPEEKNEMRLSDPRACELLRRTEQSAREQLMRTHGTIRSFSQSDEQK